MLKYVALSVALVVLWAGFRLSAQRHRESW